MALTLAPATGVPSTGGRPATENPYIDVIKALAAERDKDPQRVLKTVATAEEAKTATGLLRRAGAANDVTVRVKAIDVADGKVELTIWTTAKIVRAERTPEQVAAAAAKRAASLAEKNAAKGRHPAGKGVKG